jgi:hypothetical protein
MTTRGSRGRVRRKPLWGADTSEPVAGSYGPTHDGRKKIMRGIKGPTCKSSEYVFTKFIHIFILS